MKNLISLSLLLFLFSCHSKETIKLGDEVCDCFKSKEQELNSKIDSTINQIIEICLNHKIDQKVQKLEENSEDENFRKLDKMFQISYDVAKYLDSNCNFVKENKGLIYGNRKNKDPF